MRIWPKMSLKRQMGWMGVVTAVCMVLFILVTYGLLLHQTEANWRNLAHDMAYQSMERLDTWAQQLMNTSSTLAFDPAVQYFLWAESTEEYLDSYPDANDKLRVYAEFQGLLSDVVLRGRRYSRYSNYFQVEPALLPEATSTTPQFSDLLVMHSRLDRGVTYHLLCVSAQCRSTTDSYPMFEEIGQVYLLAEGDALSAALGLAAEDVNFITWVVDGQGHIIAARDSVQMGTKVPPQVMVDAGRDWTGEMEYQSKPMIAYRAYHAATGYSVVTMIPRSFVSSMMLSSFGSHLVILVYMSLLLASLYISVTRNILGPIKKASGYFRRLGTTGQLRSRERMNLTGNQEVEELAASFNTMVDEIASLTDALIQANDRLHEAEMLKARTEMAMLVSQINPHFLYNTLESIKGMAYSVGAPQIVEMTKALGSIFRYSVKAPEMVSFQEELTSLESYFAIQRVRFGDRFSMHIQVDPALLECMLPKMCLQPLCENAIYHGLEMKPDRGQLWVKAHAEGDVIKICVEDDGLGMEPEALDGLRASLQERLSPSDSRLHVGVANVHARLCMYFGEEFGLHVESQPGEGTCVTIHIPIRSGSDV